MKYPDDVEVYSPEASDTQRFGDWQTKVFAIVIFAILAVIVLFVFPAIASEQETLIVQFKAVNAEASNIDGCDPNNGDQLAKLDGQMRDLARKIQETGLEMNSTGDWVKPSDRTYKYAR